MTDDRNMHVGKFNIINAGILSVCGLHITMVYTESVMRQLVRPINVCYKLIQKCCLLAKSLLIIQQNNMVRSTEGDRATIANFFIKKDWGCRRNIKEFPYQRLARSTVV